MPSLAIIGEYNAAFEPHLATNAAIGHSCKKINISLDFDWVSTDDINKTMFQNYTGLWIAPGSPYKNMDKTLWAIKYARENGIPTLGTCGGFQHMIIETARNILGFRDAGHAEYDPYASELFITKLTCSLAGREMTVHLKKGSQVAGIYETTEIIERYYCNFGVNPKYVPFLKSSPLQVVGTDWDGEIRIVELPKHPFFIGTLFVPQTLSTANKPHPLVTAFVREIISSDQS